MSVKVYEHEVKVLDPDGYFEWKPKKFVLKKDFDAEISKRDERIKDLELECATPDIRISELDLELRKAKVENEMLRKQRNDFIYQAKFTMPRATGKFEIEQRDLEIQQKTKEVV